MKKLLTLSLFTLGISHAATLELSSGFGVKSSRSSFLLGVNVSGLDWIPQHDLALGVSLRKLEANLSRSLSGGPLGYGEAELGAELGYGGGFLLRSRVSGTLGPFALSAKLEGWNTPRASLNPFSTLILEPESTRSADYKAELSGRYRLERTTFLNVLGRLGADSRLEVGVQRQTEEFELRAGGTLGGASQGDLFAVTGGISTRNNENLTLSLDGLLGLNGNEAAYGVRGRATLYGALPLESDLNLYAAFEPWRRDSEALRYGLTTSTSLVAGILPAGTLNLELAGSGNVTVARVRFALELGGE